MDEGVERIKRLSRQAQATNDENRRESDADREWRETNIASLERLATAIPARLRELAEAANGDLSIEDSAYRSRTSTAIQVKWRAGKRDGHEAEIWLLRETGSVEWRWNMGHRVPPIIHRVPASKFDLGRLDDLVAALAEPDHWRDGHHPEV
jgi:hypothetical protein